MRTIEKRFGDKVIRRWSIYGEPISGIVRTQWEEYKKKDPRYNLSPPIIPLNKDISDYLE